MRTHATSLLRWTWTHRREFILATALLLLATALIVAAPLLLLTTILERENRREPLAHRAIRAGVRALVWLAHELTGSPHGPWHPCAQCGKPILDSSRAVYCSHPCRSYARLERDAEANDPGIADRAQRRLRAIRLRQLADENPAWTEIPF